MQRNNRIKLILERTNGTGSNYIHFDSLFNINYIFCDSFVKKHFNIDSNRIRLIVSRSNPKRQNWIKVIHCDGYTATMIIKGIECEYSIWDNAAHYIEHYRLLNKPFWFKIESI